MLMGASVLRHRTQASWINKIRSWLPYHECRRLHTIKPIPLVRFCPHLTRSSLPPSVRTYYMDDPRQWSKWIMNDFPCLKSLHDISDSVTGKPSGWWWILCRLCQLSAEVNFSFRGPGGIDSRWWSLLAYWLMMFLLQGLWIHRIWHTPGSQWCSCFHEPIQPGWPVPPCRKGKFIAIFNPNCGDYAVVIGMLNCVGRDVLLLKTSLAGGMVKGKGKGFPYSLPSIGPGADPGVQAVSPQVTVSHPPSSRLPLLSARPVVSFQATEHHRPLAGSKLYSLVTNAHRCEQLAQGCYTFFALSIIWTHECSQVQRSTRCATCRSCNSENSGTESQSWWRPHIRWDW